ncbi:MAG: CHASE3 domain-containing protein, partial [Bacteroidales bacterium]|nr:CHASE3 domain-containing protein [Bacteroidales bacterium]
MNKSIAARIAAGFGVVLILLIIIGVISFQNMRKLQKDASWVTHTNEILINIEQILGDLKDAETGQRGYIITGIEDYLQPYTASLGELSKDVSNLKELTSDNPRQQQRIVELESLIKAKLDYLSQTIQQRRDIGFDAARTIVVSDKGKMLMDDIRVILSSMTNEENILLTERSLISSVSTANAKMIIILVTAAGILIVIFLTVFLTRSIANPIREISGIADKVSAGDLTSNIPEINRKDEVGILIKAFSGMIRYLKEIAEQANMISKSDLTVEVKPLSERDMLGNAFLLMVENLRKQNKEIIEAVNVLTTTVSEISSTTSQLSSSSQETATAVSETSTTIEEVKQT